MRPSYASLIGSRPPALAVGRKGREPMNSWTPISSIRVYSAEIAHVSESVVERWRTNRAPTSAFRNQSQ